MSRRTSADRSAAAGVFRLLRGRGVPNFGVTAAVRPADPPRCGAIAQLGERYNGIVEVTGSIPVGSTNLLKGLAGNG